MQDAGFDLEQVDRLLSTTRAVRRRLDLGRPVEREVVLDCIRLSQQAPTGSNAQGWRWLVVGDAGKRRRLAEIYGRARAAIAAHAARIPESQDQTRRVYAGALWLADHLAEVPVHVIPCILGRPPERFEPLVTATLYGSILPAVWSFQLALRSRGLGSVWTTLHLAHEAEVRELFGIPEDVLQVALLPVAYTRGVEFRPARRPPVESIAFFDAWG
jgi:nitroreductase